VGGENTKRFFGSRKSRRYAGLVTSEAEANGGTTKPAGGLGAKLGLRAATALNITDMVGVGPFLTLPLIVAAMGGPPAVLAWVAGGVIAVCDALVWAELAASFPRAGGTYAYLGEMFGPRWGRLLSFLFAAQLLVSAPLSMASGCIGMGKYLGYVAPGLERTFVSPVARVWFLGWVHVPLDISGTSLMAAAAAIAAAALVYRRVETVGKLAQWLAVGVLGALIVMILAGFLHFNPALLRGSAAGAWGWHGLRSALPAGLLLALYDLWGYYNVAFLGEEVERPERNIPRAMLWAIGIVTVLYVLMNVSVLGVLPWQQVAGAQSTQHLDIAAQFMERLYGRRAGQGMAWLVVWTALASVFALLTGYSRIVFAAARDGNLPRGLAKLHGKGGFPARAVLLLAAVTVAFCFLRVGEVIAALVVIRLVMQFGLQAVGLLWLRAKRPDVRRPFRMWLYPVPALVAIAGFALVLADKAALLARGALLAACVTAIYFVRARKRREWPFAASQ
jgi:basic amino acid/polyamine antiporter, APA family